MGCLNTMAGAICSAGYISSVAVLNETMRDLKNQAKEKGQKSQLECYKTNKAPVLWFSCIQILSLPWRTPMTVRASVKMQHYAGTAVLFLILASVGSLLLCPLRIPSWVIF